MKKEKAKITKIEEHIKKGNSLLEKQKSKSKESKKEKKEIPCVAVPEISYDCQAVPAEFEFGRFKTCEQNRDIPSPEGTTVPGAIAWTAMPFSIFLKSMAMVRATMFIAALLVR